MANDQRSDVLSDAERAVAQRLIDEVNEFNFKATGIAEVHEMLIVETDGDGELLARCPGLQLGRDVLDRGAVGAGGHAASRRRESAAGCAGERRTPSCLCAIALDTHTFRAPRSMSDAVRGRRRAHGLSKRTLETALSQAAARSIGQRRSR
jgi:hypothetical protein